MADLASVLVVDDFEPFQASRMFDPQRRDPTCTWWLKLEREEAVRQDGQNLQPDLILLDIGLPSLNGMEAARRMLEIAPATKIIFVSRSALQILSHEALSIGAVACVKKTRVGTDLLPAVDVMLDGKQLQRSVIRHTLAAESRLSSP